MSLSVAAKPASRSGWDGNLEVVILIESGYHINSNAPNSEFLIPTSVKFKLDPAVVFGPLAYPKGEIKKLGFSEEKVSVYEGRTVITAPYKAAAGTGRVQVRIQGSFSYQACTDQTCLPPRSENFELPVNLGSR